MKTAPPEMQVVVTELQDGVLPLLPQRSCLLFQGGRRQAGAGRHPLLLLVLLMLGAGCWVCGRLGLRLLQCVRLALARELAIQQRVEQDECFIQVPHKHHLCMGYKEQRACVIWGGHRARKGLAG